VKLKQYTATQLSDLLNSAHIIEQDSFGAKVARLNDGQFLKILRRKKSWKANEVAKVKLFCKNALTLKASDIATLEPRQILQIAELQKAAVIYQPLNGTPLRSALTGLNSTAEAAKLIEKLAQFIQTLHQRGIYFRSLHADNILVTDDGFGLIDILDMQFSKRSLSIFKRARNFRHLFRLKNLSAWHQQLINNYCEAAHLSGWKKMWFLRSINTSA
jgi:tRNA A-37 threonylcarbamoyl transferase component Bud32